MKKLMMVMLFVFILAFPVGAEETWNIASLEYPPYSGKDLPNEGTSIAALKEVLSPHGITVNVTFLPWNRAKIESTSKYDGYFPSWPEEVGQDFVSSGTIDWSELSLISKADNNIIFNEKDPDEIYNKYTFGKVSTYEYPKNILNEINKFSKIKISPINDESLAKMLNAGRVDIILTDPKVTQYYVNKDKLDPVKIIKTYEKKPLVLAIHNRVANKSKIELIRKITRNIEGE